MDLPVLRAVKRIWSLLSSTLAQLSKARSARDVAIGYCQGTPLRNEIVARDASQLEEATNVATNALEKRFGSGAVEGLIRAHVITASA